MKKWMQFFQAGEGSGEAGRDRLAWILFIGTLAVYTATRLISIEAFPIYFFCDEATHSVQFMELIKNGWHSVEEPHELLPAYFLNGRLYNLSLSVYLQGFISSIFGMSVAGVRATSAIASLTGAIALALLLRRVFRIREWWSVVLFLTVIPCWFLHSRTGFETVLMVSSYSWFLYFYLLYREESPRWIFAAMLAGAATFYSYSPGQGMMLVTGLLSLLFDSGYHWKHRRWALAGGLFGLLLFVPYLRFRWQHPAMLTNHLQDLDSYLILPIPLSHKFAMFFEYYFKGFSPRYWFVPGSDETLRHIVPFNAHVPALLVPFAVVGLVICLIRIRYASYRMTLVALVACPFSAALTLPGITRMLLFVVPFALCGALGLDWLMTWVRTKKIHQSLRISSFLLLSAAGFALLGEALASGPTFSSNYGLYGLQWGAQAVFRDLIPRYLKSDPEAKFILTHTRWNLPNVFPDFFGWMDYERVRFACIDDILSSGLLPRPQDLVLMSADEFTTLPKHPEVERFVIREKVALPDGLPGYYLGHLHFKPDFVAKAQAKPAP